MKYITKLAEQTLVDAFPEDFDGLPSEDCQKLIEEGAVDYINSLSEMLSEERKQIISPDFLKWAKSNIRGIDIGKNSDSWSAVATNLVKLLVTYREQLAEQEYFMRQLQFISEKLERSLLEGVLELKDLKKRSEKERFYLHKLSEGKRTNEPLKTNG